MQDNVDSEILVSFTQLKILGCLLRILLQASDTSFYLCDDVSYTFKIGRCRLELVLRLCLSALVQNDTCGFLKDLTSVLRSCADNIRDFALPDDRITFYTDTGIHEQFPDVSEPALAAVYKVFTLTGSEHPSCDSNFAVFERKDTGRIVYDKSYLGHSFRLSGRCTGKNNILHLAASQLLGALFTEHPSESIADVALAAAVRTDDTCDTVIQFNIYRVSK